MQELHIIPDQVDEYNHKPAKDKLVLLRLRHLDTGILKYGNREPALGLVEICDIT